MEAYPSYDEERDNGEITQDSKNILIADDSLFFRTKLSDILVEAGHKVRFAKDGREVIEEIKIDSKNLDLLVLDLQMPEVDGFQVLEWMNNNGVREKLPVLVITGVHEPSEVLNRLKSLGATGLVTKGLPPEQLIFRVNRALYPDKVAKGGRPKARVAVSIPVDYTIGSKTYTGYILNISENGLYLHTKELLQPDSKLDLKFSLTGYDHLFKVSGIVARTTDEITKKKLFGGCGIKFTSLNDGERKIIGEFVNAEIVKQGLDR